MVKTRALWLLPSALADMYDDAVTFVDNVDCPKLVKGVNDETACRLLQDPDGGSQFAVPDGAFKLDGGLLDRDQELYTDDSLDNTYELKGASVMGCNDEYIRIIALYKTVTYKLTEANSKQEKAVNDVKATLETLAKPIAGVDLYLNYLRLAADVTEYTQSNALHVKGDSWQFSAPKSKDEYDQLKLNRDLAQGRRMSADFKALSSGEFGACGLQEYAGFSPDDEIDVNAWNVISTHLGDCKASLEQLQQQLSLQINDPLQAPQKPLSSDPTPEAPLGRLGFFQWGEAEFSKLLDLQKCVNFVNPSPYMEKADHLLDLVTAKVAWVLPALKLENLPQIRAMLNIGFDLTEDNWAEALQKMSEADKKKQEAQYAWQRTKTLEFFTALYGGWAKKQAEKPSEGRTAQQIIESYAFPAPKAIKEDLVHQLSDDQIMS